jgi:hypothetical protein
MPAAERVKQRASDAVGTPGSPNYQQAQSVVADAGSLSEAVEAENFLGPMGDDDQEEVRRVLRALPAHVDRAFMDSLRAALESGAKIAFRWDPHPEGGFDHSSSTAADGTVHLVLRTPPGDTVTASS